MKAYSTDEEENGNIDFFVEIMKFKRNLEEQGPADFIAIREELKGKVKVEAERLLELQEFEVRLE